MVYLRGLATEQYQRLSIQIWVFVGIEVRTHRHMGSSQAWEPNRMDFPMFNGHSIPRIPETHPTPEKTTVRLGRRLGWFQFHGKDLPNQLKPTRVSQVFPYVSPKNVDLSAFPRCHASRCRAGPHRQLWWSLGAPCENHIFFLDVEKSKIYRHTMNIHGWMIPGSFLRNSAENDWEKCEPLSAFFLFTGDRHVSNSKNLSILIPSYPCSLFGHVCYIASTVLGVFKRHVSAPSFWTDQGEASPRTSSATKSDSRRRGFGQSQRFFVKIDVDSCRI